MITPSYQIIRDGLPLEHVRVATKEGVYAEINLEELPLEHVRVATL